MPISAEFRPRLGERLQLLYGSQGDAVLRGIDALAERYGTLRDSATAHLWDERSVMLITYGDQIRSKECSSLQALNRFLRDYEWHRLIDSVHILPFFPYSSDDGFSVIDYRRVDPALGDWRDVDDLRQSFRLMFDFVLNHCSQEHQWFQAYLRSEEPYRDYFIDEDPKTDLTSVARPRTTPLLTPYETKGGTKHVWTTFSADQVDLNYSNPAVLIDMLDVLLYYVQRGADVIRLDAIAYLWKSVGTSCIHLQQTHAIVKLMRDLLDDLAPGTILLTETNVPHEENVSYFGDGDEAHMVYQFSLAPLLVDAFLTGDAGPLRRWLSNLKQPGHGMTFFNFTASHDGIGVRPLEGLVKQERLAALIEGTRARGGQVSTKRNPDGTDSPYELNITYFSALDSPDGLPAEIQARRFLTSQGVMVALRGVPGIYFHSLVGTPNYLEGVRETGRARSINRRKFDCSELQQILSQENSAQRMIFDGYRKMLEVRVSQPAFHPDADQEAVDLTEKSVIAFTRTSKVADQRVLVLANVGSQAVRVDVSRFKDRRLEHDLLSGRPARASHYDLGPYEIAWLA